MAQEEITIAKDVIIVPEKKLKTGDKVKIEMMQICDWAPFYGDDVVLVYALKNAVTRTVRYADMTSDEKTWFDAAKNKIKNIAQSYEARI